MAPKLCGVDGCKNPVKADAVGCWRHPDGVSTRTSSGGGSSAAPVRLDDLMRARIADSGLGADGRSVYVPKAGVLSESGVQVNLIINNTEVAPDIAPSIINVVNDMSDVHNLEVPSYVQRNFGTLVNEFHRRLRDSGVAPERISSLRLMGMHRRTPKGRVHSAAQIGHVVTVLDRGTPHQVAVDPFVSVMTPVRNPDDPISDQYDSPSSPLGDIPMIVPVRDYARGDYLWFDSLAYADA